MPNISLRQHIDNHFFTVKTVKTKWKNLRDYYRQELRKVGKPKTGDPGGKIYKSCWPYFSQMGFLKDILGGVNRCSNLDEEPDSEANENTQINEETDDENNDIQSQVFDIQSAESPQTSRPTSSMSSATNTSQPRQNTSRKRKLRPDLASTIKRNEELIALEKKKIEILEKDAKEEDDDDLLFLKSLLPHIKSFPVIRKLRLRSKIQDLVLKEMEEMENIGTTVTQERVQQSSSSLEPISWNTYISETNDILNDTHTTENVHF